MIQTTIDAPYGDIKWVFGKNLHLTLSFLGNLNKSQLDDLSKELEAINFGQPFNAILNHTGTFPNPDEPRVFWLGIEKGKDRIIELVNQINGILKKIGLPYDEKEFIPHVTIGRVRNKENIRLPKGRKRTKPIEIFVLAILLIFEFSKLSRQILEIKMVPKHRATRYRQQTTQHQQAT